MLWRLPTSVRSLPLLSRRQRLHTRTAPPLRILFCGSDDFSIASLQALQDAKEADPQLIKSIEVVHRPAKRTGRGLKVSKDVPVKKAAKGYSLITHKVDTFTGWTPPNPFDIVIAVSFGLLVPPRILNAAKYGGLNVHPSLLPDLRGPAPIHHTLLRGRSKTGVTVQTLHPRKIDHGTILAQSPPPGLDVPQDATYTDLVRLLGRVGGEVLVDVLKTGRYLPPYCDRDVGWYSKSVGPVDHAEKITPAHRHALFASETAQDVLTRQRVLGNVWFTYGKERYTINEMRAFDGRRPELEPGQMGCGEEKSVIVGTADGEFLEILNTTCSGGKAFHGNNTLRRRIREAEARAETRSQYEKPMTS